MPVTQEQVTQADRDEAAAIHRHVGAFAEARDVAKGRADTDYILGVIARHRLTHTEPQDASRPSEGLAKFHELLASFGLLLTDDPDFDHDDASFCKAQHALIAAIVKPEAPTRGPSLADRERVFANEPYDPPCTVPPKGWRCTRRPGHEGPCAAVPEEASSVDVTHQANSPSSIDMSCSVEALGEALHGLSARLLIAGAFNNDAVHAAYEKVVSVFEGHAAGLPHSHGALASIVADPDCCASSKAIARAALSEQPRTDAAGMREAVRAEIINAPETADFMAGVPIEATHQRKRWGADHDAGKGPLDWFWLIGYLAQKAATSAIAGDTEKALHHTISTAAALANWHAALSGKDTRMRPGIDQALGEER